MLAVVLRPEPAASGTAARLRALGHEVLVAPVTQVGPTGNKAPAGPFDAAILTSAHGLLGLGALDPARHRLFAVGSRTAAAARAAGFTDIVDANGDATTLARVITDAMPPGSRLVYLAGERRKPQLEQLLADAGFALSVVETYRAAPVPALPDAALGAFRTRDDCAILHFSRGHAEVALDLAARAGLTTQFTGFSHHVLSGDVATPLRAAGAARLFVAAFPDEQHIFRTLHQV